MQRTIAVLGVLLAVGSVTEARAQQAQEPTHLVVRSFQCSPMNQAMQYFQDWRPVVEQMIQEGHFLDYGILSHAWGDEWNVVDYFAVDDLGGFFDSFAELVRRIGAANRARQQEGQPEVLGEPVRRPFSELCTAHKDNIYAVVAPRADG